MVAIENQAGYIHVNEKLQMIIMNIITIESIGNIDLDPVDLQPNR